MFAGKVPKKDGRSLFIYQGYQPGSLKFTSDQKKNLEGKAY